VTDIILKEAPELCLILAAWHQPLGLGGTSHAVQELKVSVVL